MDVKQVKKLNSLSDNPVEKAGEMLSQPVKELAKMPSTILDTAMEQIGLKPRRAPMSGTIEIKSAKHTVTTEKPAEKPGETVKNFEAVSRQFQVSRNQEKMVFSQKSVEVERQIHQILSELKVEIAKLQSQTSGLSADLKKVTVETAPSKVGEYHLNFFEMLIRELKNLRKKINNSRLWLDATYSKKQKKGFWQMAKKHGNTFLMSDERTPSGGAG